MLSRIIAGSGCAILGDYLRKTFPVDFMAEMQGLENLDLSVDTGTLF